MGPYNAILGVLAFIFVIATIGAVDVIRGRRLARKQRGSEQLPVGLPSQGARMATR
jgi:hypothetical protein